MESIRFSRHGWVVHLPDRHKDPDYDNRGSEGIDAEEFAQRRPILADTRKRHIYVGEPGWYHHDTGQHHGVDEYSMDQGYFGGGPRWGNGKLKWYLGGPENDDHNDIAETLRETGFDIPDDPDKLESGLAEPAPLVNWADDDDDDSFPPSIDTAS